MTVKRDPFLEGIMNRGAKEEPMTSCPAAPESETPISDRAEKYGGDRTHEEWAALARSLERRLSLAQARIAELEKALTGARKHIESRGAFTPHSVAIAAIDAALKDRA